MFKKRNKYIFERDFSYFFVHFSIKYTCEDIIVILIDLKDVRVNNSGCFLKYFFIYNYILKFKKKLFLR